MGKNKQKSKNKKKRYKEKIPRGIIADTSLVEHTYVDRFSIDATSTSLATHSFLLNGMYAPNVSGSSHQPFLFDQYTGFYNHFTVLSSTIQVIPLSTINSPAYSTGNQVITLEKSGDSTPHTVFNTALEQRQVQYMIFPLATPFAHSKGLFGSANCAKMLGKKDIVDDPTCSGNVSADPAEKLYWHVGHQTFATTGNPSVMDFLVKIKYVARWHERKPIAGS